MPALPTPFEAYRLDLGRLGVDEDLSAADSMWLLVAHCLSRFADQPEAARLDLAERCAHALEQFAETAPAAVEEDGVKPLDEVSLGELSQMIDGLKRYGERAGQELLAKTVLEMSARMSGLGALTLATTLVGHARAAVHQVSERTRGLLLVEQARLTRLLGNLDESEVLYAQLHALGERSHDDVLLARAAIGRGVIARVRGNYPKARALFLEGLEISERAGSAELQRFAHQGVFVVAAMGDAWEEALRHGWLTLVLAAGDAAHEAEALVNLAHVSLGAGYPRAALHAILKAVPNAKDLRVLLPALGTAAVAAARCDERSLLDHIAGRVETVVSGSSLPFEGAEALLSLARAFDELGLQSRASAIRMRGRAIAEKHQFHELIHISEKDELTRATSPVEARELDQQTREVVSNLETLEYELVF
ncbi:MAG: tetratricopeptide repeat protein [Gemmatimonadaceae bacterium]